MIATDSRISLPQEVLFSDLDGEAVLLNLETGQYYGLDEVGTRMWSLLARHGSLDAAYRDLLEEYDVTGEQLQQDLVDFVEELVAQQLLLVDGP